jgi:hypothetical protein
MLPLSAAVLENLALLAFLLITSTARFRRNSNRKYNADQIRTESPWTATGSLSHDFGICKELIQALLNPNHLTSRKIYEEDSKSMHALKSTSKTCRDDCDTFVLRSSRLQDHVDRDEIEILLVNVDGDRRPIHLTNSKLQRVTRGLLQCISDDSRPIAKRVRHLQIGLI